MARYAKFLIAICILSGAIFATVFVRDRFSEKQIEGASGAPVVRLVSFSQTTPEKKFYRHVIWQGLAVGAELRDGEEIRIEGEGVAEIEVLAPFANGLRYRVLGGSDVLFKYVNQCDESAVGEGLLLMAHSGAVFIGESVIDSREKILAGEVVCISSGRIVWRSKNGK